MQTEEGGQYKLDIARPDAVITTNIGKCKIADERLRAVVGEKYFEAASIVELSHARGSDELIHRSLKEMATKEQLPFKYFGMNRAYYYLLVIAHFMFEPVSGILHRM